MYTVANGKITLTADGKIMYSTSTFGDYVTSFGMYMHVVNFIFVCALCTSSSCNFIHCHVEAPTKIYVPDLTFTALKTLSWMHYISSSTELPINSSSTYI